MQTEPTVTISKLHSRQWAVHRSDLSEKCRFAAGFVLAKRDGTFMFMPPEGRSARELRKFGYRAKALDGFATLEEAARVGMGLRAT